MLKSANMAATTAIFTSLVLALSASASMASEQQKFDKRIEAAAREIVAKKIGDIRGSVEADVWVAEYGVDDMTTGPVSQDEAAVTPNLQVASLTPVMPNFAVRISDRSAHKISSFLFF